MLADIIHNRDKT